MTSFLRIAAAATFICAGQASAQAPEGWSYRLEGAALSQGDADITSGGNAFSADRTYLRFGARSQRPGTLNFGLSATLGQTDYDFDRDAPWGRIRENELSFVMSGGNARGTRWFVAPSVRERSESGASRSDGRSAGVFAGVSWQVNDRLTIGPAFGAFEGLGSEDTQVFPALLLDWQIADRWSLTTGPTLGASEGPGLSLRYQVNDTWRLTLSARQETNRFALSTSGATPGGVGEDSSLPVVLAVNYNPSPAVNVALFAGAEFNGEFEVENAAGSVVRQDSYDTAPLIGLAFSFAF